MGIPERGLAAKHVDVIARQLAGDHRPLARDHRGDPFEQLGGRRAHRAQRRGAGLPGPDPQHRFAERLARDGAGVDARTAERAAPLDHRDAFGELRGLDGAPLPGGAAPDAQQVVVERVALHDRTSAGWSDPSSIASTSRVRAKGNRGAVNAEPLTPPSPPPPPPAPPENTTPP